MIGGIPQPTLVGETSGTIQNATAGAAFGFDSSFLSVPRLYLWHNKAVCWSNLSALAALQVRNFPEGSRVILVNSGGIYGRGGPGGTGGDFVSSGTCTAADAISGGSGGPAIEVDEDVIIDNINGSIFGGGGGGGGGGSISGDAIGNGQQGGGGGGGQTYSSASIPGISGGPPGELTSGGTCSGLVVAPGGTGGSGTFAAAGVGGTGSATFSASGGAGGAWGQSGVAGHSIDDPFGTNGGSGGAGGKAIELNGNTVTFVSGEGAANVKGSVS